MIKRAEVVYDVRCSCGGSVNKINLIEPYFKGENELYKCNDCGKKDYYEAFYGIVLEDNFIYCENCGENTHQVLKSFDDWTGIIECECLNCKNIIETDLTKEYCDVCKGYKHFKFEKDWIDGEYGYELYRCESCKKGSFTRMIFAGEW